MEKKIHIRLDYAPLDVAVSLAVLSENSPVTQTYDGSTGEYEPNRQLTPTTIVPMVVLNAQDGSITDAIGNESLAQMVWYVDNVDISTLSEWAGQYEIVEEGDYRGGITIYKNIEPRQTATLRFEGVVCDTRTNLNYPICTEEIILSTIESDEGGGYTLAVEDDTAIRYDQFKDRLFAYEYAVSHGYEEESEEEREKAMDNHAYLHTMPIILYAGKSVYEGEYTVKVFEVTGWDGSALTTEEITINDDDDNEFNEISPTQLVIDLRMVEKKDYLLCAYVEDEMVASLQFGISRLHTPFTTLLVNQAARKATDTTRQDKCYIISASRLLKYAESVIRIQWYTDTAYKTEVLHGEGTKIEYSIANTGAGDTSDDGWIDEYVDARQKDPHVVALSDDGDVYCDENNETLIFN